MRQQFSLPQQIFKGFLLLLVCSLVLSCSSEKKETGQGAAYKADLLKAIRQASKIVVTEHSSEMDFVQTAQTVTQKERVYRTVTLTKSDRDNFINLIEKTPDETQQLFSACIFDPHHTIYFYTKGKLASKLDICFECGQQQWAGTKNTPPSSIYGSLAKFIQSTGLQPEREWLDLITKKS